MTNRTTLQASFYTEQHLYVVRKTFRVCMSAHSKDFQAVMWNEEAITACSCRGDLLETLDMLWIDN